MNATEKRAADLLTERGVKVQVAAPLFFRIFGRRTISMEVTAPKVKTLLKIARIYLSMGISNTGDMTVKEAFGLYANHAKDMSRIVAMCIPGIWSHRFRAWVMRRSMTEKEISYLFHLIILYGGIEDFINTIRLTEATRITKPMNLSPEEKMS